MRKRKLSVLRRIWKNILLCFQSNLQTGRPYRAARFAGKPTLHIVRLKKEAPKHKEPGLTDKIEDKVIYYSERAFWKALKETVELLAGEQIIMKKLLIFGIVIVALVALYFTLYFIDVSGQILVVSWTKNVVSGIKEYGFTEEKLKNNGISSEQARDIVNHPNQYR